MTDILAGPPERCGTELDFGRVRCARLAGHPGRHAGPARAASDILAETPDLSVTYCPGCEPERDPFAGILVVHRCLRHRLVLQGVDDDGVRVAGMGFGIGAEADGANCRAAAALVRRAALDASFEAARRRVARWK